MNIDILKEELFSQVKNVAKEKAQEEFNDYLSSGAILLFKMEIAVYSIGDILAIEDILSQNTINKVQEYVGIDEQKDEEIMSEIYDLLDKTFFEEVESEANKLCKIYNCTYSKTTEFDEELEQDYIIYKFNK